MSIGPKSVLTAVGISAGDRLPRKYVPAIRKRAARRDGSGLSRIAVSALRLGGIPEEYESFSLIGLAPVRLARCDSQIAAKLFWFGEQGYEPELVRWWRFFCARSTKIVEIGANIGYFTVQGAVAASDTQYHTHEPHPTSAAVVRRNVELNHLDNVTVHEVAVVADDSTEVTLNIPEVDRYSTPAGAFIDGGERHLTSSTSFRVKARPMLEACAGADLIKIDAEGLESVLLHAAREQLASTAPTLFIELLDKSDDLRATLADLIGSAGYRLYVPLSEDNLVELDGPELMETRLQGEFGVRDVILTRARLVALG